MNSRKHVAYFVFKDGDVIRFESNNENKGTMTEDFENDVVAVIVPLKCKDNKQVCCAIIENVEWVSGEERGMGLEKMYRGEAHVYCPRLKKYFLVSANVWEYPVLAFNHFDTEVENDLCRNAFVDAIDTIMNYFSGKIKL